LEQQFVDRSATTKRDLAAQRIRVEKVAEYTANDEILLDLTQIRP